MKEAVLDKLRFLHEIGALKPKSLRSPRQQSDKGNPFIYLL